MPRENRGIKLSDEEWEAMKVEADKEHLPVSTFVRKILLDWLEVRRRPEEETEIR